MPMQRSARHPYTHLGWYDDATNAMPTPIGPCTNAEWHGFMSYDGPFCVAISSGNVSGRAVLGWDGCGSINQQPSDLPTCEVMLPWYEFLQRPHAWSWWNRMHVLNVRVGEVGWPILREGTTLVSSGHYQGQQREHRVERYRSAPRLLRLQQSE